MSITMRQFLSNPVGHGTANVARRDRIKLDLNNRFDQLYKKNKSKFATFNYVDEKTGIFTIWFRIPSEELPNLLYDVVISFSPKKLQPVSPLEKIETDKLRLYDIKVFSNSPNFTYTYAYVFNKRNLLIDWLKPKISIKALTEEPVIRNKDQTLGFEKSIYFSLLLMEKHPKVIERGRTRLFRKNDILRTIPTSNQKTMENKKIKKEIAFLNRKDKKVKEKRKPIISTSNSTNSKKKTNASKSNNRVKRKFSTSNRKK